MRLIIGITTVAVRTQALHTEPLINITVLKAAVRCYYSEMNMSGITSSCTGLNHAAFAISNGLIIRQENNS